MGALRSLFAALVVALILAGTEAVASYPRPSSASGAFFAAAFSIYLPLVFVAALVLTSFSPARGLNLWLPLVAGVLRMAGELVAAASAADWFVLVAAGLAIPLILALLRRTGTETQSPPFLFGLTVGIVLPILTSRVASGVLTGRLGRDRALVLGVIAGLLAFVLLRAFVARWPKAGPIFLLGPVVSLALWAGPQPGLPRQKAGSSSAAIGKPDIVLIVLDTVRASSLRLYGGPFDTMPGLEAFAKGATTFTRVWSDGSWTLPSHASLFSGLHVSRHGYDSGFDASRRLSPERFLAERLRRAGYATGAVAANFGVFGREDPLLTGFESVDAEPLRPFAFRPWLFDLIRRAPRNSWIERNAAPLNAPSMRAPWVVERALEFWTRSEARPRFLFVNLMEAHLPWIPEASDLGRLGPRGLETERDQEDVLGRLLEGGRPTVEEAEILRVRYHEALLTLDRHVSRLLAAVTRGDRGAGTIVVVTSDHGESLGEHDRFGHRNSLDEPATRIPLIVRGPGLGAGKRNEALVQLVDVFAYLAGSAGLRVEPDLDSRELGTRRAVVMEHRPGPQGRLPPNYPRGDLSALVEWPYKFVAGPHVAATLFDLAADPGESKNLVEVEGARAEAMRSRLRQLSADPSLPLVPRDPRAEERLRALGYLR